MEKSKIAWWRRVVAVLCIVAGFLAGQVGGQLVFQLTLAALGMVVGLILYVAVSLALFMGFFWLAGKVERRSLPDYGVRFGVAMWPKLGLGLLIGIAAFMLVTGPLYLSGAYTIGPGLGGWVMVAAGFMEYIVVGVTEELVCRGFLQHRMRRLGSIWALVLTALIFAALHLLNPEFSAIAFINIFLAGTFMGAVMYATGSLWAAVGVHITWNWVQGSVLGIPVSGMEMYGLFQTTIESESDLLTGGMFGAEASIVCTVVLTVLTLAFLWVAHKKGRLARALESE